MGSLVRNGGGRALATSAFTSAESESFPVDYRPREATAAADAPARPQDHPATEPALSRLLAPPFDNEALRGDFIASMERHLAEYEDGGIGGIGGGGGGGGRDAGHDGDGAGDGGGSGGRHGGAGGGERRSARGDSSTGSDAAAARDGCDDEGEGGDGCGGDGSLGTSSPATTGTGMAVARAADAGTSQPQAKLSGADGVPETAALEVEVAVAGAGASAEDVPGACLTAAKEKKEAIKAAAPATSEGGEGATSRSNNWAQEYHDYLCTKEKS